MFRAILFLVASCAPVFASDVTYTLSDPCLPAQCNATVINDRGEIAGQYYNLNPLGRGAPEGRDGRGFEFTRNGFIAPLVAESTSYLLPRGINNSGALAVDFGPYGGVPLAGAYSPESRTLVNLSTVAGLNGGGRAVAINDSGDVATVSLDGRPTIFGSSICNCGGIPIALTNDRRAVFSDFFGDPKWYVSIRNTTERIRLRATVVSVSSGGHILEREQFPIPNYFIYALETGERAVSVGEGEPFAINDSDQLLLHTPDGDAIWDLAGRPRLLRDLIPSTSAWKILRGRAINNRGQILADADDGTRLTSIILSPSAQ